MYCPKCGQQQVSDTTRFCPRCGLAVSGLAECIAVGGIFAVRDEAKQPALTSPRSKGVRRGKKIMFLSGALMPIFLAISILIEEPGPLLFPLAIFLAGLTLMLYARIFGEDVPAGKGMLAQSSKSGTMPGALPPASNLGMNSVNVQRVRTAELVRPPSVTEHTTRLLDGD
jgi:zinc-ribbon domain